MTKQKSFRLASWLGVFLLVFASMGSARASCSAWQSFKEHLISPEGRIVDTGNAGISHSEGQGYGLLLAVAHNDPAAFARIFSWTYSNLMIRDDGLLVWKWTPERTNNYTDSNSASDGDVLVAWALLRAGERFDSPRYQRIGRALVGAIRTHLVRDIGGFKVLLPGPEGFQRDDGSVVINLSYWIFPALERFAELPDGAIWRELDRDGRRLLSHARFGAWHLPPDWAVLQPDGDLDLPTSDAFRPVFGYNAIRVPLYLLWAEAAPKAKLLQPYRDLWADKAAANNLPLEVDLRSDRVMSAGPNTGYAAVRRLVANATGSDDRTEAAPAITAKTPYYSAVLQLLTCLADAGDTPCDCPA